jgi:NTP pyrophosphatase (non-canonical NTP hydrolase)
MGTNKETPKSVVYEYDGYAEAHGFNIGNDQYDAPRPLPCVRDERGEIREQTVKQLFVKIDEELNELKEVIYTANFRVVTTELPPPWPEMIAEEAADTITSITTLCEALGIDAEMRDEAQRRVNEKNRKRGRL